MGTLAVAAGPATAAPPRAGTVHALAATAATTAATGRVQALPRAAVSAVRAKKRTKVTGWQAGTYRSTTGFGRSWTFTVRVTGPAKRRVQLQQRVNDAWRTVSTGRTGTNRSRAFRMRIYPPVGATQLRLRFPATRTHRAALTATKTFLVSDPGTPPVEPPPPLDPQPRVTPPPLPPAPPASTHYSFIEGAVSAPALAPRWDRCRVIRWGVDFTRATAENGLDRTVEKARWDAVVAQISAATGYTFAYVPLPDGGGSTDSSGDINGLMTDTGPYVGRDVVITYASPGDPGPYRAADLGGSVLGMGGPLWTVEAPGTPQRVLRGSLRIDYGDVLAFSLGEEGLTSLYLHEFGHVMGLDHYDDPVQVMNPFLQIPGAPTAYADGDRNGLFALASQSCFGAAGFGALRSASLS
jgi:hypothetical protein